MGFNGNGNGNGFTQKLFLTCFSIALAGAWGYIATRASSQELMEAKEIVVSQHRSDQNHNDFRFGRNEKTIEENRATAKEIQDRLTSIQVIQGQMLTLLEKRLPAKK